MIRMDNPDFLYGTEVNVHFATIGTDTLWYVVASEMFLSKTGWHLATFTLDDINHRQSLYIDGSLCFQANRIDSSSIDYSNMVQNTVIGKHGDGLDKYNCTGMIDVVRISRTVCSAHWIKLCFMNQKADDRLLVYK